MTNHIVCLAGPYDTFTPSIMPNDSQIIVPFDIDGHPDTIQNTVSETLDEYGLTPPSASYDLLRAAIGAYTADVRVARHSTFDRWTRDFVLYLPVRDPTAWSSGRLMLARLLAFLTGDHWTVQVRPLPSSYRPATGGASRRRSVNPDSIACLFSGGLDSFIGAVDLIERAEAATLIGHHSAGNGATSVAQNYALRALRTVYTEEQTSFLRFWVSPPKGRHRSSETTTRGRSILFLGLGITVASSLRTQQLVVPENGFISLNVPLTSTRLGSFSTRTTHPHLISLLRELLATIGLDVQITLPHRFQTKGEMISQSASREFIMQHLTATVSCAHPSASRFSETKVANQHCGYCVPCLIRRAAITSVSNDPTEYTIDDLRQPLSVRRGWDLRAFKLALERFSHRSPKISDVLLAGPLPGTDQELWEYLSVFQRGLTEVDRFITRYA